MDELEEARMEVEFQREKADEAEDLLRTQGEEIEFLRARIAELEAQIKAAQEQEPDIDPDEAFDMGLERIAYYTRPIPSAPAVPEGWLRAVDTEMITTHLGVANADDDYETARKKLHQIIDWHVSVALDPAVNGGKVLVPVELLNRVQDAIGRFVSDEGWGQSDMETCDDVGAILAAPSSAEKKGS